MDLLKPGQHHVSVLDLQSYFLVLCARSILPCLLIQLTSYTADLLKVRDENAVTKQFFMKMLIDFKAVMVTVTSFNDTIESKSLCSNQVVASALLKFCVLEQFFGLLSSTFSAAEEFLTRRMSIFQLIE